MHQSHLRKWWWLWFNEWKRDCVCLPSHTEDQWSLQYHSYKAYNQKTYNWKRSVHICHTTFPSHENDRNTNQSCCYTGCSLHQQSNSCKLKVDTIYKWKSFENNNASLYFSLLDAVVVYIKKNLEPLCKQPYEKIKASQTSSCLFFWATNGPGGLRLILSVLILNGSLFWVVKFLDQYQYLGNCPLNPPLTQQQSIDNKLRLMLG